MSEWFEMGGYGVYVWSSYGVFALMMLGLLIGPLLRRRKIVADVKAMQARQTRRRANQTAEPA